ncbi:MAG: hypothetical protein NWQ07_05640 [Flaviramulus sp.]|nr:hypothetical protein [Flaviramulus sp.]
MDLQITSCNNFFNVKGILNRNNVHVFQNEFKNIFNQLNEVTISIQEIESMDKYGVAVIAKLHEDALIKNKKLSIIGFGCKDLYDHFKTQVPAA